MNLRVAFIVAVLLLAPFFSYAEQATSSGADPSLEPDSSIGAGSMPADPVSVPSSEIATATPQTGGAVTPRPVSNPVSTSPTVSAPAPAPVQENEALPENTESTPDSFPYIAALAVAALLGAGFGVFKMVSGNQAKSTGNCDEIKKQLEVKKAGKDSLEVQITGQESAVELAERKLKEAAEKKINEKKDALVKDVKNTVKEKIFGKEGVMRGSVEKGESVYATYKDIEQTFEDAKKLLALLRSKRDGLSKEITTLESSYAVCVGALSAGGLLKKTEGVGIDIPFDRLVIKKYSPAYQKQVKNLVVRVHEEYGFPYDPTLDYDLENPEKIYVETGGMFSVLLDGEDVAGTVAIKKLDPYTAELKRMYLLKKYRGHGWGSKLLNTALSYCREQRFKKCILDTSVRQEDAQAFYRKKGFAEYKTDGDTIYMSLDIPSV